ALGAVAYLLLPRTGEKAAGPAPPADSSSSVVEAPRAPARETAPTALPSASSSEPSDQSLKPLLESPPDSTPARPAATPDTAPQPPRPVGASPQVAPASREDSTAVVPPQTGQPGNRDVLFLQ